MEEEFRRFLKRGGRSDSAARRAIAYTKEFERYLQEHRGVGLNEASPEDLEAFVAWVEQEPKASAKGHLWGLGYYYEYTSNEEMRHLAGMLRAQRIERRPFPLREFRGINPEDADKLLAVGIWNVEQMLEAGKTARGRTALAEKTGVAEEVILELVKLSDLARIPGIKGIRARLYYDAGVDTIKKMAEWEPEALREMAAEFVERTGFEGIAPLPAEVRFSIARARQLPKIVEY
jgi:hypothetical protein